MYEYDERTYGLTWVGARDTCVLKILLRSDQDYGMHDCYVTWGRTLSAWSLQKNKFRTMGHMYAKIKCDSTSG